MLRPIYLHFMPVFLPLIKPDTKAISPYPTSIEVGWLAKVYLYTEDTLSLPRPAKTDVINPLK